MVRVVLIDDDPLVRAGLKLMLGGREGVDFVGEGSDGSEAAALVAEHRPTCCSWTSACRARMG